MRDWVEGQDERLDCQGLCGVEAVSILPILIILIILPICVYLMVSKTQTNCIFLGQFIRVEKCALSLVIYCVAHFITPFWFFISLIY